MSLITTVAARLLSGGKIFRVPEGAKSGDIYDILRRAAAVRESVVIFEPGYFLLDGGEPFDMGGISRISGYGPCITHVNFPGPSLWEKVYDYPILMSAARHTWEEMTIGGPGVAIKAGGSYGTTIRNCFFIGGAKVQLINTTPRDNAVGVWTEGARLIDCQFYGGGIQFVVDQPDAKWQSFCGFQMRGCQIGPSGVGIDTGRALLYAAQFQCHFNLLNANATAMRIGAYGTLRNNSYELTTEGAGTRLEIEHDAIMYGSGYFIRDDPTVCGDKRMPMSHVGDGILQDSPI